MSELRFIKRWKQHPRPELFFCDVDRTLLTHDHVLLSEVSQAARALKSVNLPFILASARSPVGLTQIHSRVEAADIVCCFNGAWVGNLSNKETLREERLERSLAQEAFSVVHEMGGSPIWFDRECCYALRQDEAIARLRTNVTGDALQLLDNPGDAPGAPFKLLATIRETGITDAVATLSELFANKVTIAQSGPNLVELVGSNTRKDHAASLIATQYGLAGKDAAAAGDSDNDAEMLRWAGLAITVSNAKPRIQELADIVAPSCDEGGLALALDWLVEDMTA